MSTFLRLRFGCLAMVSAIASACIGFGAEQKVGLLDDLPSLTKLMNKEDFQRTGLEKLSKDELAQLDQWMRKFANSIAVAALSLQGAPTGDNEKPAKRSIPSGQAAPTATVVESSIDGTFEGWSGDTIFKLMNGQIWQQASYSYTYHYAFMPKVTIYPSSGGFTMKVDGMSETVSVKRLR